MRFFNTFLLLLASGTAYGGSPDKECETCNDKIRDARTCMDRNCGRGTSTDRDQCLFQAEGYQDFIDCCGFRDGCKVSVDEATACVDGKCVSPCVLAEVFRYVNCLKDEKCDITGANNECIDVLDQAGNDAQADVDNAVDTGSDAQFTCAIATADARDYCEEVQTCCPLCVPEMGGLLDCVYNDVLVPWLRLNHEVVGETNCPVAGECGARRSLLDVPRSLQDSTNGETNGATNGETNGEESLNKYYKCGEKMTLQMIAGNATQGVADFMNCSTTLAESEAVTDDSGKEETTPSGAAATGVMAVVAAVAGAAVSVL